MDHARSSRTEDGSPLNPFSSVTWWWKSFGKDSSVG